MPGRIRDWFASVHPMWIAAIALGGAFTAGMSFVYAVKLPQANAEAIAAHIVAFTEVEDRVTEVEDGLADLAQRVEQQLCLDVADRDPTFAWQQCLSQRDIQRFRAGRSPPQ